MQERLTGLGVLSSRDQKWNADDDFAIATSVIRAHGSRTVQGHNSSIGRVLATDGAHLPERLLPA